MISDCAYAEELYDLVPLQVLQWINILTSAGAIVLVCYPASHYLHRTIFEKVTKGLIISLYVFIVIFSVCLILVQGSQLAYRYTARVKCDAQSPKVWCIFRYLVTVLTSSFALVHVGITVQHGLYSFLFSQRIQQLAARFSIIISGLTSIIFGVLAYNKDSLEGRIAYCSGSHWTLSTLASFLLWKFNERSLLQDRQSFDFARTFHRRQNLYAMQQFFPISTLHAISYAVLFLTVYFSESIKSLMTPGWYLFTSVLASIIPHYCFLCPLMFLFLIRRGRFQRASLVHSMINPENSANDIYFTALKDQWQ